MRTMGGMDVEDMTAQVADLVSSASAALESDVRAGALLGALPALDASPVRVALAGPTNAGKTMLIGALLKLSRPQIDELTAATPKTSGVTPYEWEDCILLDLPGTLSGLDDHDREAAAGVRRADLLMLVTSVELPGEVETEQMNRLLSEEGFAHRCFVVVNKSNAEESDPDIVRLEMEARIGAYPWVQVIFSDARDYLDSLNFPDLEDEERELLLEDSGIPVVEEALRGLVSELGGMARLHAICHEVRRVCADASSMWEADTAEESLAVAADRIRLAFAHARAALTDSTDLALSTLQDELTGIGSTLAAEVSEVDGTVSEGAAASAGRREEAAFKHYEDVVTTDVDVALTRLVDELGTASQQWARYSSTSTRPEVRLPKPAGQRAKGSGDKVVDSAIDAGMGALKDRVDKILKGGVRPGSPAHDLGKKINNFRGIKAKSHTHVHTAETITKYGRRANTAIQFIAPALDFKEVVGDVLHTKAVKGQRDEIERAYAAKAQAVAHEERGRLDAHIEDVLAPIAELVDETLSAADESSQARLTAQGLFGLLSVQARDLAAVIDQSLAMERRKL